MSNDVVEAIHDRIKILRANPLPRDRSERTEQMVKNALVESLLTEIINRVPFCNIHSEVWLPVHTEYLSFADGKLEPEEVKRVVTERLDQVGISVESVAARHNNFHGPFIDIIVRLTIPPDPAD